MALLKNYTTEHGIELPKAYLRIDSFRGTRDNMRLGLSVYASEELRRAGKPSLCTIDFMMPTPNGSGNLFADAYNWLKTQESFATATDV